MGFGTLFGSTKWKDRAEDIYNRMNVDNRQRDFNQYAGEALNGLAGRGVINSSVGSKALSDAAAQAQRNYDQLQMQLLNYASQQQDDPGFFSGLTSLIGTGIGAYFGGPIGASIGGAAGNAVGQIFQNR